jgi:shikimate kinase
MKILLCGFMGSGKTTIYKRIMRNSSGVLGIDLDDLVQAELAKNGESLGAAIKRVGWKKFRETEQSLLFQKLKTEGSMLVSLGGGSLSHEALKFISDTKEVRLVWLKTDFETCWARISASSERPLVKKGKEALMHLFQERELLYSAASLILDSEQQERVLSFEELDDGC